MSGHDNNEGDITNNCEVKEEKWDWHNIELDEEAKKKKKEDFVPEYGYQKAKKWPQLLAAVASMLFFQMRKLSN